MFSLAKIVCPFVLLCYSNYPKQLTNDCPSSCECYESKTDSINLICDNIEGSSLSELTSSLHLLTFVNITFDDRVIFGPGLNYIPFNHLIIEGCGGSSQVTNNRRERQFDNETLVNIPGHKSLTITNSRHIFDWKWSQFNFNQILIENSTLSAYHSSTLTRKFVTKVIGSSVTWLSLIDNKITSIQSGSLSELINLRYLQITRNQGLTRITRDSLPEPANQLWSIDLSENNLNTIESNLFNRMSNLIEVNLSGNKLINLDYVTIKSIWPRLQYFNVKGNQLSCQNLCWSFDLPREKWLYPYEETDCYLNDGNRIKLINSEEEEICNRTEKLLDIITRTTANLKIIS